MRRMWKEEDVHYWYRLASAQLEAGMFAKARESIAVAKGILRQLRTTLPSHVYPAAVSTINGVKWGYIDAKGRFVISPRYGYAEEFQENGLAIVQVKDLSGVINRTGRYVIEPVYFSITSFSEGRAAVIDSDQGFQVMDESGRMLTSKHYNFIGSYQNGRALFQPAGTQEKLLYGYLDRQGQEVIPAQFEAGGDFKDDKAVVQIKEGEYALIGPDGERLQTYLYAYVGPLGDGLLEFRQTTDGPYGYISETGTVVIPPKYTWAQPFENGRAVVGASADPIPGNIGLIDKKGNFLIKPEYDDIQLLGEGRAAVGKAKVKDKPYLGSTYAIADIDGRFLSDFVYQDVTRYQNGYASGNDGRRTFFIDRAGQIVSSLPIVSGAGTMSMIGSLVKANVDRRISYYDRTGKLIYAQNSVIPLAGPYRVRQEKYAPNKDYNVYYPQMEGMATPSAQERVNRQLKELSQVKPIDPNQQLDYSYSGDFSVFFFKDHLVVLELTGYEYPFGAAHGMPSRVYAHVDLQTGRIFQLKDLFKPGSNYVKVLSDIIGEQIKNDPQYDYVFPDAYKGIKPDQPFYVTEEALSIYFAPYEIAAYAVGFPTFTIPYKEIMTIIDLNGSFWKSFHEKG
jgi:hypothetical protein